MPLTAVSPRESKWTLLIPASLRESRWTPLKHHCEHPQLVHPSFYLTPVRPLGSPRELSLHSGQPPGHPTELVLNSGQASCNFLNAYLLCGRSPGRPNELFLY